MKYFMILLFTPLMLLSQERDIKGYVYYEDEFIPISEVDIVNSNNKIITQTDTNGYFTFKLGNFNKTFFAQYPGLQIEEVNVIEESDLVYIFMITDPFIDFVSLKKTQRIIKRDRRKLLKKIYPEAIKRGMIPKNTLFSKQSLS